MIGPEKWTKLDKTEQFWTELDNNLLNLTNE